MAYNRMSRFRRNGRSRRSRGYQRRGRFRPRRMPMTNYRVRRLINAELKRSVLGVNGEAPAVTGEVQGLTDTIVQGDLATNRNGNWIKGRNIHGTLQVNGTDSIGQQVQVRAMIIRWNEDASVHIPTLDQVVNNPVAPGGQFNFENKGQFKVCWTKNFLIVNQDNNPRYTALFKIYMKIGYAPNILYGTSGAKKFHYYFIIFSDTDAVGEVPDYRLDLVTRFTDS